MVEIVIVIAGVLSGFIVGAVAVHLSYEEAFKNMETRLDECKRVNVVANDRIRALCYEIRDLKIERGDVPL